MRQILAFRRNSLYAENRLEDNFKRPFNSPNKYRYTSPAISERFNLGIRNKNFATIHFLALKPIDSQREQFLQIAGTSVPIELGFSCCNRNPIGVTTL